MNSLGCGAYRVKGICNVTKQCQIIDNKTTSKWGDLAEVRNTKNVRQGGSTFRHHFLNKGFSNQYFSINNNSENQFKLNNREFQIVKIWSLIHCING